MSRLRPVHYRSRLATSALLLVFGMVLVHWFSTPAYGAQLGNRELLISDNAAASTSEYLLSFTTSTAGTIGSIDIRFCSNSPFPTDPCVAPAGFSASGATLSNQTGITGFTINGLSTANNIILSRAPSGALIVPASYTFTNMVNPAAGGSYFARIQTYANPNATGLASDYGGIAFSINGGVSISAEVPPYLTFCTAASIPGQNCSNATGQYVNLGELSSTSTSSGTSQALVATNAGVGYSITIFGPPMSSGVNSIGSLALNDISRTGTPQFGLNLVGNSAPGVGSNPVGPGSGQPSVGYNTANSYRFVSGDSLVTHAGTELTRVFTTSYIVNVPANQAPGIYVTTLTYICLAKF